MKLKSLVACVAVSMCLTATAWGAVWDGSDGLLWSNGNNWTPAGVPLNEAAIINNGLLGSPTLNVVGNITNLEVSGFSTLNINAGADLTATGSGSIAGGGFDEGYVNQTAGTVSFGTNLTLGNAAQDFARWTMTTDSTLGVTNDLTVGGGGEGLFELRDTGILNVGGNIGIATQTGGAGVMTVSGGTLTQTGGSLAVSGVGTFRVEGDDATISLATYSQGDDASLSLEFNNTGISTINVSGNVIVDGTLRATVATGASLPSDVYDLIVSDTGTVSGQFDSLILDHTMQVRYELNDAGKNAVRLYVDTEAPELPIQGQLPDTYDKIISINLKHATDPDIDEHAELGSNAGVVAARNWNNMTLSTGTGSYGPAALVDNSGAQAVSMTITQSHSGPNASNDAAVSGDPSDPNLNLYKSRAPSTAWNNPNANPPPHDAYMTNVAQTTLTDLQAEFPYGYDVIVNVAQWTFTASAPHKEYVEFWDGSGAGATQITESSSYVNTVGAGNTNEGVYDGSLGMELEMSNLAYSAGTGFVDGKNYVILRNQIWDTLELRPRPDRPTGGNFAQNMQITGVQVLGLAPNQLADQEFIVDNLDFENPIGSGHPIGHIERIWVWNERGSVDEWDNSSYYTTNDGDTDPETPGHQGNWFRWHTPTLLFEEATDYEVFVWYSAERPTGGYYNSDSMAMYTVHHAGGVSDPIIIDQNVGSGTWVSLGFFPFTADSDEEYVQLERTLSATGPTSADAVKWVWTQPFVEVPEDTIPEPAGLGLTGLALLAMRRRRS